jgi:hypothetical protein
MGYLGVGGLERNFAVGQANREGAVLLNHVNNGYVDQRDMDMAGDMLWKMQNAQPDTFCGPFTQMAWQQQMNGAVNIYNLVQNRLSSEVNGSQPGLTPNFDLPTQPFVNAQPNLSVDPYVAPQPFFCPRPFASSDPYFMAQPFYGATMGEEFAGAAVASLGAFELMRHLEGNRFRYDPTLDFSRGPRFEERNLRQFENRNEPRPFMPVIRGWQKF